MAGARTCWGMGGTLVEKVDVLISGGGPAGAAAAYRAASAGARVVVCEKATFPRDKPCGDGLTPRAVHWLNRMGLDDAVLSSSFHRVDTMRVVGPNWRSFERRWPDRKSLPSHGFVAERTVLDEMIIRQAQAAGARLVEGIEVRSPIVEHGAVRGARVLKDGTETEIRADITIAADGMTSRLGRAIGLRPDSSAPFAIAVRAQVDSRRPDDSVLECFATLRHGTSLLPGYGWVFPMGAGRVNVGIGYISTYKRYRDVKANAILRQLVESLPREWNLPSVPEMIQSKQLSGWRLPMALAVWPPWRPGIMAAGDAVAAGKPFTGSGISKALESGTRAADAGMDALANGDPRDLSAYERTLNEQWGSYYRFGQHFVRALGHPWIMRAVVESGLRFAPAADTLRALCTSDGGNDAMNPSVADRLAGSAVHVTRSKPSEQSSVPALVVENGETRLRSRLAERG